MSASDKPKEYLKVKCNYCNHIILDNNLLEHLLLKHKTKYFKIIGNINYINSLYSKNIDETTYILDKNLSDKLLDLYINDHSITIEDYLLNSFMNNLYEYNNIKYIENNIFIVYHKNKWIIDINNQYVDNTINIFIHNIKEILKNHISKYKSNHIIIFMSILKLLESYYLYELIIDNIKKLKN